MVTLTVKVGKKAMKIKRDRIHTSKRGCLPAVRAIFLANKPIARKELVAMMMKKFGPKAVFAVQNYITFVKRGTLHGVTKKWAEEDGILRPKGKVKKNGTSKNGKPKKGKKTAKKDKAKTK